MALSSTLLSQADLPLIGYGILVLLLIYYAAYAIYNVYFHPLRHFPGPRLAAATRLYSAWYVATGGRHRYNAWAHDKYGEVVRTAPEQLSFINDQAWRDVVMHRQGHPQLKKMFAGREVNGAYHILSAPDDVHARQRKTLSHAFSERALREQEPLIRKYIDLLVFHMREDAETGRAIDIVGYFNFLTFDIIADLAFGRPFGALQDRKAHPWMATFFRSIKIGSRITQAMQIPGVRYLIMLIAWPLRGLQRRQFQYTRDQVTERLKLGKDRPDFIGAVLRNTEKAELGERAGEGLSRAELDATFNIIMIGGSETTATLLSGCIYLLQKSPDVKKKLQGEVRRAFANEDEITLAKVNSLPYLLAVLEESLRFYPPVPTALSRKTPPEGMSICGQWVPGNTAVGVPQLAAYHSPLNFVDPEMFMPERFLPDRDPKYDKDRRAVLQPFSAGPRNCIGRNLAYAEMKLILSRIMYNFDLELANPKDDWLDQDTYVLWDKKPLMLYVKQRKV